MFNLSGSEIVVILLLALLILGPEKLPDAMRKAGKTFAELKKLSNGFQDEVRKGFEEPVKEVKKTAATVRSATKMPAIDAKVKNALTGAGTTAANDDKPRYNPAVDPPPEQPPGSSVAEPLSPEPSIPDASTPEVSTPELSTPELSEPELSEPELSEPEPAAVAPDGADAVAVDDDAPPVDAVEIIDTVETVEEPAAEADRTT